MPFSRLCLVLACLLAGPVLASHPAAALQFSVTPFAPGQVILWVRGTVVRGDTLRLRQALANTARSKDVVSIAFDSPGGNVAEGIDLANEIHRIALPIVIPGKRVCASICFLVFAAAPTRYVARSARVGVHSAADLNGRETQASMAATTVMAREAARLGVPAPILGKMVQTAPGKMTWLTDADLASMNVVRYDPEYETPPRRRS